MKRYHVIIKYTIGQDEYFDNDDYNECLWFINGSGDHVVDYQIEDLKEGKIVRPFYYR